MKLGITGSRSIKKFDFSELFCKRSTAFRLFLGRRRVTRIICGGAKGVDTLAETSAAALGIPVTVILPDYHLFQKGAPLKRNQQIVEQCDALLAIWNGKNGSHGTIFTIRYALNTGKRVFLISCWKRKLTVYGEIVNTTNFDSLLRGKSF